MERVQGLPPIYTANSNVLVLGTFPSEKSREKKSYYANNGNRFWKVVCDYIGIGVPDSYEDRINLLNQEGIALWDLIESCEIKGSKDSSIKNPTFNDLKDLLDKTKIDLIILNGKTALKLFKEHYKGLSIDYVVVPHTSAVNATFDVEQWQGALLSISNTYRGPIQRFINLCGNNPLYEHKNGNIIIDDYAISRTCVECGVQRRYLEKAILSYIKREKL